MTRLLTAGLLALVAAQPASPPSPAPVPAIDGVIDALRLHQIVAISDPHGSATAQAFVRRLLADDRFAAAVDDLILEIGNARYQALVDDYLGGGAVDESALAEAWLNTTVANQIHADVEWFRRVRQINRGRPAERRIRILLADPPIDWTKIYTRDDHLKWLAQRDSYPAALIQTEVIAKNRRALVVYGHLHYQRFNMASNLAMDDWRMQTIVSLVERAGPTRIFTVWTLSEELTDAFPEATSWPRPALAAVRGTSLGRLDIARLYPKRPRMQFGAGKPIPVPIEAWAPMPVEQQLDAVMYLAPSSKDQRIQISNDVCARPGFLKERLRRISVTGIPRFEAEAIEKLCSPAR